MPVLLLTTLFISGFFSPAAGAAVAPGPQLARTQSSPRQRLLLDFNWRFHLGNSWGIAQNLAKAGTGSGPASQYFSDASWRPVQLPHDWAVELPFDPKADGSHGFKALGVSFPENSVAWYRRTFDLPKSDEGRRLWLEFDGVFRDAVVFVNGWCVGHHESGYNSFRYDITDVANYGGPNIVAVKVDATQTEGWFYEGAGIYRHVWLVKTGPLAIAPNGISVRTEFKNNVPEGPAQVHIDTQLLNKQPHDTRAIVRCQILDAAGKSIGTSHKEVDLDANSDGEADQTIRIPKPALWSPESPVLYKLSTTVESNGQVLDRMETEFGFRTVAFDPEKGFLLNGKPYVLKGTCNHQDHAGVGAALPDALQYFRISRLKEMGCNAYRTSHNPPTPELLEACDRLGMLVMDENRLLGSNAQNLERLEGHIRRDRNHPSVAIWSIANEEFGPEGTVTGGRVARTMQDFIRQLDDTRPITYPAPQGNEFYGINSVIEVRGWNYHVGQAMDDYHHAHPTQPNVGTEQASTVSTRGIYANDKERGYVSAYDTNTPSWGNTAEQWWTYFAERPWLSGGFVWTGFDYRGEPTPYSWPCINSHFGILDTCGFPKDNFWYYQSQWTSKPVLHLLPHWTWPEKEGQNIDVRAFSNCEEVKLFLNGSPLPLQRTGNSSELMRQVKYAPGTLLAKGFNNGNLVATETIETCGAPAKLKLTPDRTEIKADGENVSIITFAVTDSQGRVVPTATNLIHFQLTGPGKILGVGNGDPSCHEPDVFLPTLPQHSREIGGWKWHRIPDPHKPGLTEVAKDFDDSSWAEWNVSLESGPLGPEEHGVFRTRFTVSEQDLRAESIELSCGRIDENGWVYVNGEKVGESYDWQAAPLFNIKRSVHPGENTVAVVVANYSGPGGLNKGTSLTMTDPAIVPAWSRSVFNGLGQVLVQSSKTPGQIQLEAAADGLASASVAVQSSAWEARATVP
jgi:beta-galactosidase